MDVTDMDMDSPFGGPRTCKSRELDAPCFPGPLSEETFQEITTSASHVQYLAAVFYPFNRKGDLTQGLFTIFAKTSFKEFIIFYILFGKIRKNILIRVPRVLVKDATTVAPL